jgi:hypothetical protein
MSTTVYVAMICDRHADPEPYVFTTQEMAITYAATCVSEYARHPEDIEDHVPPPDGWLYYTTYSPEGDAVWVLAKQIDAPEPERT